jgi:hypothetical protein
MALQSKEELAKLESGEHIGTREEAIERLNEMRRLVNLTHNAAIDMCIDCVKHCSHADGLGMGNQYLEKELAALKVQS